MRRVGAILILAAALGACGTPRPGISNGSLSACYRAIPAARTAVNDNHASLVSVHRVAVDKVTDHLPASMAGELDVDGDSTVCVLAFKGTFAAGQVSGAPPAATGSYAVVLVSSKHLSVLASVVLTHLPSTLGEADPVIKYIGSKRRLVPVLGDLLDRARATTAIDLFSGTTRVGQEWKRRGAEVTAVDSARYAATLAQCYVATDAAEIDGPALEEVLSRLQALPGTDGYVTETFSRRARYFQGHNARRIDAIRDAIEAEFAGHAWYPVLLTSLLLAADRVDSTTGLQMAYLKAWSSRSYQPLQLQVPALLRGPGRAIRGDATEVVTGLPPADLAYLDPPYNQHRYVGNYHVWETLVAWDAPEHYGVACKRVEVREPATVSAFNRRREAPAALAGVVARVPAEVVVVSGSDEGWIGVEAIADMAAGRGAVEVLAFDSKRYVGAQIGIHDPTGKKVGQVGRTHNLEYLVVAGPARAVSRLSAGYPTLSRRRSNAAAG